MTKLAPEWVRTSDPVIRSPARYRWTTAPAENNGEDGTYFSPEQRGPVQPMRPSGGRNTCGGPKACGDRRRERSGKAAATRSSGVEEETPMERGIFFGPSQLRDLVDNSGMWLAA